MRMLPIGVAVVMMVTAAASSAATVENLTDQLQRTRTKVVKVDRVAGKILCAESGRWVPVAKQDLDRVQPGDVVRLDRGSNGQLPRLVIVRTAAQELASPEN